MAVLSAAPHAQAIYISVTGYIPNTQLAGNNSAGTPVSGAYVDAYYSGDPTWPSTFNNNFLVMGDGTAQSNPLQLSTIPYVTGLMGELYFMFTFDSQETQQGAPLQLDQIRVLVGGVPIWTMTDGMVVNGGANPATGWDGTITGTALQTAKPLGNGADLSVFIPVWLMNGLNLTGTSTLVFEVTESLNSNGNDEWKLVTAAYPGTAFFQPNQPVYSPAPVPEPGTCGMLAAAGLGLAWSRWRRA